MLDEELAVAMLRAFLHVQVIMCSKETPQIYIIVRCDTAVTNQKARMFLYGCQWEISK